MFKYNKYNRKKEIIKNIVYISIILIIAIVSTHYIYFKFQDVRTTNYNSESLDVTYREKSGNKITISKITPVTDSVGLSSKAYLLSIKNNLTETVPYKIKIIDDTELMELVEEENIIPKEDIRISIKAGKINKVYDLSELEDGVLIEDDLDALEKINISIRVWIRQDSTLPAGSNMDYHGIIQVIENDNLIAIAS